MSLQSRDKDVVWDSVNCFAQVQVGDVSCSPLIHQCCNPIVEGHQIFQAVCLSGIVSILLSNLNCLLKALRLLCGRTCLRFSTGELGSGFLRSSSMPTLICSSALLLQGTLEGSFITGSWGCLFLNHLCLRICHVSGGEPGLGKGLTV